MAKEKLSNDFEKELRKAKSVAESISAEKAKLMEKMKELEFQEEKSNISSLYGNVVVDIIHKVNPEINLRALSVIKGLELFLTDHAGEFNSLLVKLAEEEKKVKEQLLNEKKERAERKKAEKVGASENTYENVADSVESDLSSSVNENSGNEYEQRYDEADDDIDYDSLM